MWRSTVTGYDDRDHPGHHDYSDRLRARKLRQISGTAALNAPVDQVWAAFNDPAVLARTLPGCKELREVGPDAYQMTITAGVA